APRTSRNSRFALRPCSPDHEPPGERNRPRHTQEPEEEEETLHKPWNLRPRKPAAPVFTTGSKNGNGEVQEPVHPVCENGGTKSFRLRGETMMQCGEKKKKKKKEKFWIALSKEEIEEDIFVMTGSRPSRRPKKRPKIVQKQVDNVFPGLWLVG
ncbi:DUF1639 domain-containing protein, partial [Escherichia coli]|nr:DUF1639 domain-containing protein [Escherichia coli]